MAKKKGRDPEKKAALLAKKEAKQEKSALKRIHKGGGEGYNENGSVGENDDENDAMHMDRLLQQYKQQDLLMQQQSTPGYPLLAFKVVACDGFPLARAHATVTLTTDDGKKKKRDAFLFGGEYHDGAHTVVSDQLFKYELATNQWKQYLFSGGSIAKHTPPPRCSHAAAYYNKCLYIFGGEHHSSSSSSTSTTASYRHHRDLWKFDTTLQQWKEIKPSSPSAPSSSSSLLSRTNTTNHSPSARSGASMTVWKHFLLIFGGFTESEAAVVPRWYNDVHVLNLQTEQWLPLPQSRLAVRPEPRSACHAALVPDRDQWLIHGGFAKLLPHTNSSSSTGKPNVDAHDDSALASETLVVHTDSWILQLQPLLTGQPPTWERWTSSLSRSKRAESARSSPNGRCGVGAVAYGQPGNMLLFGGVVDEELHHHKVDSIFYNDLSLFHVERRKFIPIRIEAAAAVDSAGKAAATHGIADDTDVGHPPIYNDDDDSNNEMVVPKDAPGWDLKKLRSNMFSFMDGDGHVVYERIAIDKRRDTAEESKQEKPPVAIINRTEPLPRIKACLFVNGHTLYVYGGILEVGDREVTLDDMWCIDLNKNRKWQCLFPGTMHQQVWRGAVHDDDDSYYSSSNAGDRNELSDDDAEEEEETKECDKIDLEKQKPADQESPPEKSLKQKMIDLVELHRLDDMSKSPQPGEDVNDFYNRTLAHWNQVSIDSNQESSTDSKLTQQRGGFALAQQRFDDLQTVMDQLVALKLQRKREKQLETTNKGGRKYN